MIVYCKENEHNMYLVAANLIASQILKKPGSVFGIIGNFDEHEQITSILRDWVKAGYLDFSQASIVEYEDRESFQSDVDLLLFAICDNTEIPRLYECYQAIKNSDQVLAVACGKENEHKVRSIFEEHVLSENPAAIVQSHENVILVGEKTALSGLS